MTLFLVQHLLVFISVLSLTMAQTALISNETTTTTLPTATSISTPADLSSDPCYNYTVLDDSWRSTSNQYTNQPFSKLMCDFYVGWVGWYRLFIYGQSTRMPDTCVPLYSCGAQAPMWLSGGHPAVQDGVVTRTVYGSWNNNCTFVESNPIRVKACPGGYFVYEFVRPNYCNLIYCADVTNITATPVSTSAAPQIFYPFSSAAGDTNNPPFDDGSSSVIQLMSPFVFFGLRYQQIYVNNNGFLTFSQPSSEYAPYFPAYGGQDIIAGLWTDIDNRARGVISYNQYTGGNVLTRATQDINNHFPNLNFNASWVFVATWDKVAYYALTNTETSFQVVLISGSNYSFVLMNYGNISITGLQVEAGYDTIFFSNFFVIPGSVSGSSISSLSSSSNVDVPGRWAFRVDSKPKLNTDVSFDPCYNYTVLDDPWRAVANRQINQSICDKNSDWFGWYRLFINGQSAHMPDVCVPKYSCGTYASLWLKGGHPAIEDGVVTRDVCGNWLNDCCQIQSNPIRVKACPGGYYVYEIVRSSDCLMAYCADTGNNTITPGSTSAAPQIFYPVEGTINAPADDGSSSDIQLMSPFIFFGRKYQQIYVNNNGFLTFNQPSSEYVPDSFPANGSQDIIAGLWTDLDNRATGVVSYHQYTSGNVLTRATQDINNYFPNLIFNASWVFAATWDKVSHYRLTNTEISFQVVLISDSHYSFILMNYGNISATTHQVEAGYDTISSTNYSVTPGSINGSSISNLSNSSNVNVPGRFAFRVDGGINPNIDNIIGLQMELSSYLDLSPDSGDIQTVLQQIKQVLVNHGLPNSIELKLREVQQTKP